MRRPTTILALLLLTITLTGCADFFAYNFARRPRVTVIPEVRLSERADFVATAAPKAPPSGGASRPLDRTAWYRQWVDRYRHEIEPMRQWPIDNCELAAAARSEPIHSLAVALWGQELDHVVRTVEGSYSAVYEKVTMPKVSPCPAPGVTSARSIPNIQAFVDATLLRRVDDDHDRLLVGKGAIVMNEKYDKFLKSARNRTSTVLPASLSLSVVPSLPAPKAEAPGLFLSTQGAGQQAIVEFARAAAGGPRDLETLLKALRPSPPAAPPDFEPLHSVDLTMSSILNTPDLLPRFDYVTTYLYIHPRPYAPNGNLHLAREFWMKLITFQIFRAKEDRSRSLESDIRRVWANMAIRVESVTTTVVPTTVDIANVTRASLQGLKGSATTALSTPTTPAGATVGATIEGTSQLTTQVQEALKKQLDQRSTYLSENRDMLRITQRGMDAVNVGGSMVEKIVLRIPPASTTIQLFTIVERCPDGKEPCPSKTRSLVPSTSLAQPLYSRVEAIAINLAVVRLPHWVKRSATEKFGLPDSANAFEVVHVGLPQRVLLWQWPRVLNWLAVEDLRNGGPRDPTLLRTLIPARGRDTSPLAIPGADEAFIPKLKGMIYGEGTTPAVLVACRKDNGYLLKADGGAGVGPIFIGKESDTGLGPFAASDLPGVAAATNVCF
jgi:hypothetical protein